MMHLCCKPIKYILISRTNKILSGLLRQVNNYAARSKKMTLNAANKNKKKFLETVFVVKHHV